jgi:cell division septum initiation protein DivIVA
MNWSEEQQSRFDELRRRELAGALTAAEQVELDTLMKKLTETADAALSPAVTRLAQEQTTLQGKLQRHQEENEELAKLLHQQEQLINELRRWLADFDKRQRQIAQAYTRLTGDPLNAA